LGRSRKQSIWILIQLQTIDNARRGGYDGRKEVTMRSMGNIIAKRINNYYRNAYLDYGVTGECINITDITDGISFIEITWKENGETHSMRIANEMEETPEQIFYIWMEERE
jgi:hypothetical protein